MPEIVYDIFTYINVGSFLIALLDKIFCGGLAPLFWLSTLGFGGMGSTIGCLLFRHRTRNGDLGAVILMAAVQFGIFYLLERIF